jgi:hypothetical protein
MTQTSYPFDAGTGATVTEAQYSQMFRRLQWSGVHGTISGTELKTFGDSSGMQVKVPAGFAFVRGHMYKSDATETLAITAANATNPRRDLVVLRLNPTSNSVVLAVVTGTAAASPTDPTLTQTDEGTFELPIARVTVAANATTIAAGAVTDLRTFTGSQFAHWSTTTRPATPRTGDAGYNTTTSLPEYYNGSAWVAFTANLLASMISATEQANIDAGKIRAGGTTAGAATTIFVQSGTPTANATGDLWFW